MSADREARGVLTALDGLGDELLVDDLAQLRKDAEIGRALRAAAQADCVEPLIHVSWVTPSGRTSGRYLGDPTLAWHRQELADAALALLSHLEEDEPAGSPVSKDGEA